MDMTAFKNVLKREIKRKVRTKEEYQEIVANWLLKGWLTDEEATDILAYLDEVYPEEEVAATE